MCQRPLRRALSPTPCCAGRAPRTGTLLPCIEAAAGGSSVLLRDTSRQVQRKRTRHRQAAVAWHAPTEMLWRHRPGPGRPRVPTRPGLSPLCLGSLVGQRPPAAAAVSTTRRVAPGTRQACGIWSAYHKDGVKVTATQPQPAPACIPGRPALSVPGSLAWGPMGHG